MSKSQNEIKKNVEDILYSLMEASAQELLDRIRSGEASPQDISNAIRLCKENDIDIRVNQGEPLDILSQELPFEGDNVVNFKNG